MRGQGTNQIIVLVSGHACATAQISTTKKTTGRQEAIQYFLVAAYNSLYSLIPYYINRCELYQYSHLYYQHGASSCALDCRVATGNNRAVWGQILLLFFVCNGSPSTSPHTVIRDYSPYWCDGLLLYFEL